MENQLTQKNGAKAAEKKAAQRCEEPTEEMDALAKMCSKAQAEAEGLKKEVAQLNEQVNVYKEIIVAMTIDKYLYQK